MRYKSNKNLNFHKDKLKSYVFITDGKKDVGILMWHYKKKIWVLDQNKTRRGLK